jgi:putative colanic acid biosynthesis glycosyltransferase
MNVLQINSVCGVGSTGRIATDLHALLSSNGHQSTVAFGRDTAKNCDRTIHIGNRLDNNLHVLQTRLFDTHGFGSMSATKVLIEKIRSLDPDIIHLHNLHGYYLHIGLLFDYLKEVSKPVIWTLHDCWAFTGHCAYFDYVGCDRWKVGCHDCPSKKDYPKSIGLDRSRWNYRKKKELFTGVRSLTLVTPSNWLAGLVKESFLQDYPVKVVNNGIDLSVFQSTPSDFRKRFKLEEQFIMLGVASTWNQRKGFQYFLDLAKQLRPDEKIVLVGVSEEQIKQLPSAILGITKTDSAAALAEIYSAADVFINPTLEDNFPTTNLESLACGTPVITFKSGGSPECLNDGCGGVVDRGDVAGLVAAIEIVRKVGKKTYTKKCRDWAESRFNKDARLGEYLDLYQAVI